ncbi:MAG: TIGR00269 family protein [archaeon]
MAKCFLCKKPAVIDCRYGAKSYCAGCFTKTIDQRISKTIRIHEMIKTHDHVAVGYSGGKDSGLALYKIAQLSKKLPMEITAITVDEGTKGYRDKCIELTKKYCKELGVRQEVVSFKQMFGITMDQVAGKKLRKGTCSYCAVYRRKALNNAAREIGADRLVIAHNLDDEVQSIVMNYFRGDLERSARLGAKSYPVYPGFVQRIKPIRNVPERETLAYCLIKGIPFYEKRCPYSHDASRNDVKRMLNQYESIHPGTKQSLLNSFDDLLPLLKAKYRLERLNPCAECGEPASGAVCRPCSYLKEIQKR